METHLKIFYVGTILLRCQNTVYDFDFIMNFVAQVSNVAHRPFFYQTKNIQYIIYHLYTFLKKNLQKNVQNRIYVLDLN